MHVSSRNRDFISKGQSPERSQPWQTVAHHRREDNANGGLLQTLQHGSSSSFVLSSQSYSALYRSMPMNKFSNLKRKGNMESVHHHEPIPLPCRANNRGSAWNRSRNHLLMCERLSGRKGGDYSEPTGGQNNTVVRCVYKGRTTARWRGGKESGCLEPWEYNFRHQVQLPFPSPYPHCMLYEAC